VFGVSAWRMGTNAKYERGETYDVVFDAVGKHSFARSRAVVDRAYPLEDVLAATRYVESELKLGNVVLTAA
jgi:hypothetical protein